MLALQLLRRAEMQRVRYTEMRILKGVPGRLEGFSCSWSRDLYSTFFRRHESNEEIDFEGILDGLRK